MQISETAQLAEQAAQSELSDFDELVRMLDNPAHTPLTAWQREQMRLSLRMVFAQGRISGINSCSDRRPSTPSMPSLHEAGIPAQGPL